ncbi:MAG: hypothetical protein WA274_08020, partial [Candidatus Acidiferrales bacterium]
MTWASTSVPDQWFGSQLATTENLSYPQLQATSPPATDAGVVNVKIIDSAGLMAMFPQSFTYG